MIDTEADTLADLAIGVRDRLPQVCELLLEEISRATIHHAGKIPHNVITMNAEVEFVDEASEATRIVQLVYPRQADIAANRISLDRKSTRLNSRHYSASRMPSSS